MKTKLALWGLALSITTIHSMNPVKLPSSEELQTTLSDNNLKYFADTVEIHKTLANKEFKSRKELYDAIAGTLTQFLDKKNFTRMDAFFKLYARQIEKIILIKVLS